MSSARSWAIAASSEVTLLATSATCWVTSCACCCMDNRVPRPPPASSPSVAAYTAAGIFSSIVAVDWDGWFGSLLAFSAET